MIKKNLMKERLIIFMVFVTFLASFFIISTASAEEEVKKIQDNSFLIEEAYNQEAGVIQHIQTFQYFWKSKSWFYTFVQEWPVPNQTHQLSYSIPVSQLNGSSSATGLGDIAINYRYQLILKGPVALAPRFSLILPNGDDKKGLGNGALGYQINIPLSVELSDKLVNNWNAGFTFTPNSKGPEGVKADTFGYNLGTSLIWLKSGKINFLIEAVWNSYESLRTDGTKERVDNFFINPGIRYAFNFKSGLQIVPGIAMPIGIGPSMGEYGIFLYLSFEHPLF